MLKAKLDGGLGTGGLSQLLELALGFGLFIPWSPIKFSKIWAQRVGWLQQPARLPGGRATTDLRSTLSKDKPLRLLGLHSVSRASLHWEELSESPQLQTSGQVMAETFSEHLSN